MHPLARSAAALALALFSAACTAPSAGPAVAAASATLPSPPPIVLRTVPTFPVPAPSAPASEVAAQMVKRRPSRAPTLEEIAAHASGIYLARIQRSNGFAHFIVTEIWRADPGRNVAVGDEVQTNPERQDMPPPWGTEEAIVYFFSPHLVRADGTRISRGSDRAYDGRVLSSGLSLAETQARLRFHPPF